MNPNFTVRLATRQDNNLLADLGHLTFDQAFAPFNTPADMATYLPTAFSPGIQARELADPENVFWLVEVGSETAGYVKLFTGDPDPCISATPALKVARLYLRPEWQGQGIGRNLLQQAEGYARDKGFKVIWLTVWSENKGAIKLYEDFGFRRVGSEDFILGQDVQHDYILEKIL